MVFLVVVALRARGVTLLVALTAPAAVAGGAAGLINSVEVDVVIIILRSISARVVEGLGQVRGHEVVHHAQFLLVLLANARHRGVGRQTAVSVRRRVGDRGVPDVVHLAIGHILVHKHLTLLVCLPPERSRLVRL